jgi:hypothetical protein
MLTRQDQALHGSDVLHAMVNHRRVKEHGIFSTKSQLNSYIRPMPLAGLG